MIDAKYTTLVFKTETPEQKQTVRDMSQIDNCTAWMLDHALVKLDLIEKAIEEKDFEKVEKYFHAVDVTEYIHELEDAPQKIQAALTA